MINQKNNYKLMLTTDYKENKWEEIVKKTKGKNNDKESDNLVELVAGKCLISLE